MNDKIIGLLKKDEFVSGELLAKKLDISRTAIWKQIKSLKDIGYEIDSVKNKGYRLVSKPDIPLPEEIKNIDYSETPFSLEEVEKIHIKKVLQYAKDLADASNILGVDPATLYRKRKKYDL